MTALDEQETTVTSIKAEGIVYIYTANPVHLRTLRAHDSVEEVEGRYDWGTFKVSSEFFDPLKGFKYKRKPMTEEQRTAAAERLRIAREAKGK